MNPKTAAQWLEAGQWLAQYPDAPRILAQEAAKRSRAALRRARPARPALRLPGGKKTVTLPKLKKELDRVFSLFIRQRYVDADGMDTCATCTRRGHWREMDAGHYVPRQDLATRWDEDNVWLQCKPCNAFRGGEPEKMAQLIDFMRGAGAAAALRAKSRQPFRVNRQWLEAKIAYYKAKVTP